MRPADRIELWARRALDDRPKARETLVWYHTARRYCSALAEPHGLETSAVAGAVAALSPRQMWETQLAWTPRVLRAVRNGAEIPGPGFKRSKRQTLACLQGTDPLDVLRGPKVRAFYSALYSLS